MRTTVDIPEPLLDQLRALARDRNRSLSAVVVELIERGAQPRAKAKIVKGKSGFPMLTGSGRLVTTEDVRALEDDA